MFIRHFIGSLLTLLLQPYFSHTALDFLTCISLPCLGKGRCTYTTPRIHFPKDKIITPVQTSLLIPILTSSQSPPSSPADVENVPVSKTSLLIPTPASPAPPTALPSEVRAMSSIGQTPSLTLPTQEPPGKPAGSRSLRHVHLLPPRDKPHEVLYKVQQESGLRI